MREKVKVLFAQPDADFDGAQYNFEGTSYYIAAFLRQQGVEKALKALFFYEKKGEVPQSHSLVYLASNTGVFEEHL